MTRLATNESARRSCTMQRSRIAGLSVGVAAGVAILGSAREAHADIDFQLAGSAGAAWMRSLPALTSPSTMTADREVPKARIPVGGSLTWAGAGFDLGATVDDRIVVPGIGIAGYGAVGS
jgi:hypothetical protein